jgi:hypothetical protein
MSRVQVLGEREVVILGLPDPNGTAPLDKHLQCVHSCITNGMTSSCMQDVPMRRHASPASDLADVAGIRKRRIGDSSSSRGAGR